MSSLLSRIPLKSLGMLIVHVVLMALANNLAFWLRFDGDIPGWATDLFLQTLPLLLIIRLLMFIPFRLYGAMWQYTSLWDVRNLIVATACGSVLFFVATRYGLGHVRYPRSVYLIDALLLIALMGGIRITCRIRHSSTPPASLKRVLIYGAGDAGERLVRELLGTPSFGYSPIGFVDDDASKTGRRIHGVKVFGTRSHLPAIMRFQSPHTVMIAIPSVGVAAVREIAKLFLSYNVSVKILPDLDVLLDGKSEVNQLRNLSIEDVLHRPRVDLDRTLTAALLKGKRVLVTGAGGSIGSELCRQILSYEPDVLVLYERYENSLFAIHGELVKARRASQVYPVVGDVTDHARLQSTMRAYEPHILFHAAAHKHVPLMEYNPSEAVRNNVAGTRTVAALADEMGVERFVMVSTDKAVCPSSVMGATKRIAELLIQDMARRSATVFVTVRFGNVLGSNGSVVPHFLGQIQAGGPVTVTHPDVQRYFMLIPEAVELVLQAAAFGQQGLVYVLEMGEQVRLQDLARHLIRMSGFVPDQEIPITFTGLRPGEKLYEELVGPDEVVTPSPLPEVLSVRVNQVLPHEWFVSTIAELERLACLQDAEQVLQTMHELVPTFQPSQRDAILALERDWLTAEGPEVSCNHESQGRIYDTPDFVRADRPVGRRTRRKSSSGTASVPARSLPDRAE